MTTQELEQVILEYIQELTGSEYIGKINIQKLDPVGYRVEFGLAVPEKPLVVCAWLDDDAFIDFIKEDIRSRSFHQRFYGTLKLVYPEA